jgi:hypothetical protein
MRVRRASTSCVTSLTILALSLGASVVNHLARRCGHSAWRAASWRRATYDFALPREQDEVPGAVSVAVWRHRAGELT